MACTGGSIITSNEISEIFTIGDVMYDTIWQTSKPECDLGRERNVEISLK